jgi:hypothetical protein
MPQIASSVNPKRFRRELRWPPLPFPHACGAALALDNLAPHSHPFADFIMTSQATAYRFSGHETFPCRYAWLPKAVRALEQNRKIFSDEDSAIVELGVGKNMVRAIRFWVQASGIAAPTKGGYDLTEFGRQLLGEGGIDPFLEDVRTLWLIHWNLSTDPVNPLFAWDYLLNRWQEPELTRRDALKVFEREAAKLDKPLSPVTLEHHFDVFLHTYVPTRGSKGEVQEDNLDCPLVELDLIQRVGDRESDENGKREPVHAFRREEKPDITPELFVYCLDDFWRKRHATEATLPFREIAHGHGSPGQIFKLPEEDLRSRVEELEHQTDGIFAYSESANLQQVRRSDPKRGKARMGLLDAIYAAEDAYA